MANKGEIGNGAHEPEARIKIVRNGPYVVSGNVPLRKMIIVCDETGYPFEWRGGQEYPRLKSYTLCSCGQSKSKPYCDGSHAGIRYDGTETASRKPYLEQARRFRGPAMDLTDAEALCASARFCDRAGTTWRLTRQSNDPEARRQAVEQAGNCPGGRLTAWDKDGNALEPRFGISVGLVEDPALGVSGPIWVRGGIRTESADGTTYEVRNRVTLCRCGRSRNRPFCDGTHVRVKFRDGEEL